MTAALVPYVDAYVWRRQLDGEWLAEMEAAREAVMADLERIRAGEATADEVFGPSMDRQALSDHLDALVPGRLHRYPLPAHLRYVGLEASR